MKILLAPLQRLANLIEEQNKQISEINSVLTVDLVKVSTTTSKELKIHTGLLTDIKGLLKEQIKATSNANSNEGSTKLKMPSMFATASGAFAVVAMAGAIVAASGLLQLVRPISADQLITSLAIGGLFVVIAPIFSDISESLNGGGLLTRLIGKSKGLTMRNPMKMAGNVSLAMIGMAAGIMGSSFLLSLVRPISMSQAASAILIGIMFIPLGFAFGAIIRGLAKANITMNAKGLLKLAAGTAAMVAIAAGIALVATVFNKLMPDNFSALPPLKWILKAGILLFIFSFSFKKITRAVKGLSLKEMIFASIAMPIMAAGVVGIAFAFQLLEKVKSFRAPDLDWALKAGLSILIFAVPFSILALVTKRVGVKGIGMAALGIVAIAGAILAVAWIFSYLEGVNFIAPPIAWAIASALAITAFAVPFLLIGFVVAKMQAAGPEALLLGAAGIILIAGTMWVVAWIFSKLPDLSAISKNFTDAVMYPIDAMITALGRFKNEIGIGNMIPMATGLLAIAGGWLALTGALAGTAVGGLISGIANIGTAIFDGISSLFGGKKTKSPIELLDILVSKAPAIVKLANPIAKLGKGFATVSKYTETVVTGLAAFVPFIEHTDDLESSAKSVEKIAKGYKTIATSSNIMNVDAIKASARMFEAIADIAKNKGKDPITQISEKLMDAVEKLAKTVKALEASNSENSTSVVDGITGALSGLLDKIKGTGKEEGETGLVDVQSIVDAIKELEDRFDSPIRTKTA